MKAWQFVETGKPLELIEKEDPKAGPGEVVIDVKGSGLCHSDVGVLDDPGWMDLISHTPIIMGHEVAGQISEVGEGVTDFKVGDKVGVCPTGPSGGAPGYARDGGFAEKAAVPAVDLVRMPEGLQFDAAAAATDAGMTSYHGLFGAGQAKPGMKVGLIGIGGLGQIALQAAVANNMEVYCSDMSPQARDLALELGAKGAYEDIDDFAQHDLPLIVDYAGADITTQKALNAIAYKGRVVLVGMAKLTVTVPVTNFITKQATLVGSNGGTQQDIADIYELMAAGKVTPTMTHITFDEIPEGINRLRRGEVKGRLVAMIN